jgi:5-oxoprolinase (ATP-hydrolysing) subunit A
VVTAIAAVDRHLRLLAPPDSEMLRAAAAHGIEGTAEGFADRAYRADGTLVPRTEPGAVLTDPDAVVAQAEQLAGSGRFGSLCLHSDTPGAAELAVAVRNRLIGAGFEIRPFS